MRICFIASANAIHSKIWIEYFVNLGYEIHWISLTESNYCNIPNISFYSLQNFPLKTFDISFNILPIRKLIKKIKPDILHAHYAGINGVLGALSGFHPYVLTAWGSDILDPTKSKLKKSIMKIALKKADYITCNGEFFKGKIAALGINTDKIKLIQWGIDVDEFKYQHINWDLKNNLGLDNSPVIISLRNFDAVYDIETLINCIPLVLKEIPNAKFLIAGKGLLESKLKKMVQSLDIVSNVSFLGWLSHNDVKKYFALSDVYVSTSLSDGGLSQSTGQAMAFGLPVITSDLKVNRDFIINGFNGILFPVKKPIPLADNIIMLLKSNELRKKFGENGRKTIVESLNLQIEMEKANNLYKSIINT